MFVRLVVPYAELKKAKHAKIDGERILIFEVEDWFGAHMSVKDKTELWDFRIKVVDAAVDTVEVSA